MRSARSLKSSIPFIVFVTTFCLAITFSSFSQTKQSYRNHEEIDVGNGMKVEILKCTGEGPTEECDCIYFTDKRQNGTRMKQNANRIREEERAAFLAKGINKPQTKKPGSSVAASEDNRADKAIPKSLTQKTSKPVAVWPTLEEAAKKADSVAKASSQKIKESLAKVTAEDDSTEMDQVFIPKVTETGGTRLESSVPAGAGENIKRNPVTAVAVKPKDTVALVTPNNQSPPIVNDTIATGGEKKENIPVVKNSTAITPPVTSDQNAKAGITNNDASPPVVSTPGKTNISDTILKTAIKDTAVIAAPPQNDSSATSDDNGDTYVKQYKRVTRSTDNAETANKKSADEVSTIDTATISNKADLKIVAKTESGEIEKPLQPGTSVSAAITNKNTYPNNVKNAPSTLPVIDIPAGSTTSVTEKEATIAKADEAKNAVRDTVSVAATPPSSQSVLTHNDPAVIVDKANNKTSPVTNESSVAITNRSGTTDRNVIGKSAEVNTKGEWEKATIIDKETEFLYKVHYRGRSADHDEWVSVTQIRNINGSQGSTATSAAAGDKATTAKPAKGPKVNLNCSFEAPAPPVSSSEKFSEKIAKRKIYEQYVNAKNTVKTGLTFLSMEAETPIVNAVSITSSNVLEIKFAFAPAGAMIYPVKTEYKVCEQVLGKTSSKTMNGSFACFRNKEGAWACTTLE